MALKCICPHEDDHNEIVNAAEWLTLDQAAAVATGYRPCCASWVKRKEFIHAHPNEAYEVSLFRHELQQEVASGEFESKANRLNRTERLINRQVLERWLAKRMTGFLPDDEELPTEDLGTRRARAIFDAIQEQKWNPKSISIEQKTLLRKLVAKKHRDLYFTPATFDKAWVEGGRLKLFAIKDKAHYTKVQRPQKEDQGKKS